MAALLGRGSLISHRWGGEEEALGFMSLPTQAKPHKMSEIQLLWEGFSKLFLSVVKYHFF